MPNKIIQVEERPPLRQAIPLSIQHMFAMFGASVLVPTLFQIDPAIVLLMNGLGTLFFMLVTKGKAPAYLGSSFAFIAPALLIMKQKGSPLIGANIANPTQEQMEAHMNAFSYAQGGFVVVGLLGCVLAFVVYKFGTRWIDHVLPPAAMGPVVALIGLELASTAAGNAGLLPAEGQSIDPKNVTVFLVTLCVAVFGSILFRKFLSVIPILIAIVAGYVTACFMGLVNFNPVQSASFVSLPHFQMARFDDISCIITMIPVLLVITSEHIGHQIVTSKVVGRDLLKKPGLHRSLLGDNFSSAVSGLFGSVPTTTYGENIGVMAMTKVYSVWVIGGAAVLSIICGFIGPFSAFISTIPQPVIGGISFLLYGMIGASGLRILVDSKVDYGRARNQALTAIVFVTGLSGITVNAGSIQLKGMVLACIVGMVMGLLFYIFDKLHWTNDSNDPDIDKDTISGVEAVNIVAQPESMKVK